MEIVGEPMKGGIPVHLVLGGNRGKRKVSMKMEDGDYDGWMQASSSEAVSLRPQIRFSVKITCVSHVLYCHMT
jgi:hypothetical protein